MSLVERISVSLEASLLKKFEVFLAENGFPSRSEAVKALIRKALIERQWQQNEEVAGTISLVYDHHKRGIVEQILTAQHAAGELIVCTQHVHLNHHNCMEVLVVRGKVAAIRKLADSLNAVKGLKHCALCMATTGDQIA